MVVGDRTPPDLEPYCQAADRAGVPLVLQVRTWPGEWLPAWRQWYVSVADWQELVRRHPSVVGAQVVELNCFGFSTEERLYMVELMEAVTAQHKFLSWQEANDGSNLWLEVGLDREFYQHLCRAGASVLPQWEMNIARSMYLCQASLMGLWLAGAVQHFGVEAQSWYWHTCGYTRINTVDVRYDKPYRQGDREAFPPSMWAQMLQLGAMAGATVYSIEPTRNVIWLGDSNPALAPTYHHVIVPFFRALAHLGIPSREDVEAKIRVAYHADFANAYEAETSDVDYFRARTTDSFRHGRQLHRGQGTGTWWKGSYGIKDERDMIPGTGRYYWLPVLPKYTPPEILHRWEAVIPPNTFAAESEVRQFLDQHYALASIAGEGFWAEFDDGLFLMHSEENTARQQILTMAIDTPWATRAELCWWPHASALVCRSAQRWTVHQQGRADYPSRWRIHANQPLEIAVDAGSQGTIHFGDQTLAAGATVITPSGDREWTVEPSVTFSLQSAETL
jgi:hypothetical protein